MRYDIEDLPDEMLDNLLKKVQEEKIKRANKAYHKLVDPCLNILTKLADEYPYAYAGNFEGNKLDWSDIYNIVKQVKAETP